MSHTFKLFASGCPSIVCLRRLGVGQLTDRVACGIAYHHDRYDQADHDNQRPRGGHGPSEKKITRRTRPNCFPQVLAGFLTLTVAHIGKCYESGLPGECPACPAHPPQVRGRERYDRATAAPASRGTLLFHACRAATLNNPYRPYMPYKH